MVLGRRYGVEEMRGLARASSDKLNPGFAGEGWEYIPD